MEPKPQNPATSAAASTRVSPSPDEQIAAFDLVAMRAVLKYENRLTPGMTTDEIRSAYLVLKSDRKSREADAKELREREAREQQHAAIIASLKTALNRHGSDPDGMTEETMRERLKEAETTAQTRREAEIRARAIESRRKLGERLFSSAGCPKLHFDNLHKINTDQNPKWTAIRDLLARQSQFYTGYLVALLGTSGTGKTQLLVSVIHRCCEAMLSCQYTTAGALFRSIRATYTQVAKGERGKTEDEVFAKWCAYDLLVIDEIADRRETEAEQVTLTNLLDARYRERKCTVLAGNLTKAEFAASVGDSIVSRIHETGEAIVCDWPSYRKPDAKAWRRLEGAEPRKPSGIPVNESRTIDYAPEPRHGRQDH